MQPRIAVLGASAGDALVGSSPAPSYGGDRTAYKATCPPKVEDPERKGRPKKTGNGDSRERPALFVQTQHPTGLFPTVSEDMA